ncbi:hypothetical protein CK203_062033 [Vitis vinifera]|uniref:Retrovirus-related Pol polyprotein from transposon TNT 1-94 n=1 Tax=Vitis vinifera TaxID=29760 RepID=A0A438HK70_VITVI|nr:hypothetical protein CK203_062033 [Vitis vinifera]
MQKIPYASAVGSLMYAQEIGSVELIGYSDSDFVDAKTAEDPHQAIFICWLVEQFHGGLPKQTLVTSSTMEAEFVACYEASNQGIWLRNFVTRLRVLDAVQIYVTIDWSSNDDVTKATLILCQYS